MPHRPWPYVLALSVLLCGCDREAGPEPGEDCRELSEKLARLELEAEREATRAESVEQMNEAIELRERYDMSGAERGLLLAIELDPTHADAYFNLGQLYRDRQRWIEAEKAYRDAIEQGGDEPRATYHFRLGSVLVAQGIELELTRVEERAKWREAIESFSAALALDPELYEAHFQIGMLHERLDEPEQANGAYRKCIELNATHSPCFVALGNMYVEYGFPRVGMAVLETGVEVNSEDAAMWTGLGRAWLNLDRPKRAVEAYGKARGIDPEDPQVLFGLGMAYAEIPMYEEAEQTLSEFLNKAGDTPEQFRRAARDTIMRVQGPL